MSDALKTLFKPAWELFRDALPAKTHVQLDHFRNHGRLPNLAQPVTFSEKIAHRKLYDRDPRIPPLVDKISAKQQMAARFGAEFVIPTLAAFDTPEEIDFAALPYPCVVKPSHASGFNVFLEGRPADEFKIRRKLQTALGHRHQDRSEEWAYSMITPRLFVEPLVTGSDSHGLIDYKFHTFRGRVYAIQVDVDRYSSHARSFFDPGWEPMPFELLYPASPNAIPPPDALKEMLQLATQIGAEFSYVRVDLYEIEGEAKFGEATFYPGAGLEVFRPRSMDAVFGAQWEYIPLTTQSIRD